MQNLDVNTQEILDIVEQTNIQHIAIIMDGNRRWAKVRNLPSAAGHKKGVEALKTTLKACAKFNIKYLTVYAFSTENWKRSKEEVSFLMSLLAKTIVKEVPEFIENDIKLKFIGDRKTLSKEIIEILEFGEDKTKDCKTLTLQIAFNYGARLEITNAVQQIAQKVKAGELDLKDITEDVISNELYTKNVPDPDLLIRTGNEKRISNYLLWQCAYTELYVTDIFWPEFGERALREALLEFNLRQRRFGK